ncbi:putative uncharacterized protein [Pseudomonas sp. StFLB209]|nr:putative uncharacterized protein [Pseudomonas sp. StFLB209]
MAGMDWAVRRARQGRSTRIMMMAANIRRRVVVPCAPTAGKRLLARDAPVWIEAIAINSNPSGKSRGARLRDEVVMTGSNRIRMDH